MDFTGTLIQDLKSLPDFWWVWLIIIGIIVAIICKRLKVSTGKTVWISLLAAYVLFILFETVIGRKAVSINAAWIPFWSYTRPAYRTEIILNYILFIPLGVFLYGAFGKKLGLKVALIGFGISAIIELIQLVAHIGLFEFDDIFGNTIGCFLGAVLGKVVIDAIRPHCNHCEQGRKP